MLSRIEEYKGQIDLVEGFSRLSENNKSRFKVFLIGDFGSGGEYMWVLLALILREELFNLWSSTLVAVFTT